MGGCLGGASQRSRMDLLFSNSFPLSNKILRVYTNKFHSVKKLLLKAVTFTKSTRLIPPMIKIMRLLLKPVVSILAFLYPAYAHKISYCPPGPRPGIHTAFAIIYPSSIPARRPERPVYSNCGSTYCSTSVQTNIP